VRDEPTPPDRAEEGQPGRGRVLEVARVFLRLGVIGFGGPAAHVALLRDDVVVRRRWVTEREFIDAFGAVSLLPGPSSTQLGLLLGRRRAGIPGLVTAGVCFITPAMLLSLGLAYLYVRYGSTPSGEALLYGVKPVVVAIVAQAVWQLGRTTLRAWLEGGVAVLAIVAYVLGTPVLLVLLSGALAVSLVRNRHRLLGGSGGSGSALSLNPSVLGALGVLGAVVLAGGPTLPAIFLEFLKIGAVVFGSGYALLAFLRTDLVVRSNWLTEQQLLDAVSIGQFTPGPVFSTATFIGYLLGGVPGALLATLGIFLPSFLMIGALTPFLPRVRRSPWTASAMDGVNAAVIGVIAGVTVQLARGALIDVLTVVISLVALVVSLRWRINSAWLIVAGAGIGLLHSAMG